MRSSKKARGTGLRSASMMGVETLEGRRLYAGNTLTINGTPQADEIFVFVSGSNYQVSYNGAVTNYPISSVSSFVISGGNGDDDLEVNYLVNAPVAISGGSGTDVIFGGSGNDTLYGNDGQDYIRGKNGNDIVDAGAGVWGVWTLSYGDAGNDTLYGGDNEDKMYGGTGADVMYPGGGGNVVCCNDGDNNDDGVVDYAWLDRSQSSLKIYAQGNDYADFLG